MTRVQSLTIVALAAFTVACGGGAGQPARTTGDVASPGTAPASTAAPAVARTSATSSTADFGVSECDEYLKKYTECVSTKVPEQVRTAMIAAVEESKSQWKVAALTADGRAGLAQSCRQAMQAAQASLEAYGCTW